MRLLFCLLLCVGAAQEKAEDSWVGRKVFYKEAAVARVDDKPIDKAKQLPFPALVEEEKEGQLRLGRAWINKADCLLPQDALPYFAEQIRQNPKNAAYWNRRGICYAELGDLQKAIADFDESIRLDPTLSSPVNGRGIAKYQLGNFHSAIVDYDRAIQLDPKDPRNFDNRGLAKNAIKDYRGAIADFSEAIKLDPKFALSYNNRGNTKRTLSDLSGAIADYDEAIRLHPSDPWPFNNRGWIALQRGDEQKALQDLDEAIRLDGKTPVWKVNKAFLLAVAENEAIRDPKLALELAEGVVNEFPPNGYILNCLSCAMAARGNYIEAIAMQDSAAKDREWLADEAIDGGGFMKARNAAWEAKKLWHPPRVK